MPEPRISVKRKYPKKEPKHIYKVNYLKTRIS